MKKIYISPTVEAVRLSSPMFQVTNVSGGDSGITGGDSGSSSGARSEKFWGYTWEDDCVGQEEY
ncbi:MAG: hypothetical protein J5593_05995 [Bacteroidaceae bacterium]|nr:hypothetical protein [Bacteroidaceae bacterium]